MPFGLVSMRRLTCQTKQIRPIFSAKSQEACGPCIQNGGSHRVTRSTDNASENCTADGSSNGIAWNCVNGQGGGLRHEVPRCRVELSSFKKRFKDPFIHRQANDMPERLRRELQEMCRMAQRAFNSAELAAPDHLDPAKPERRRKRLNLIYHPSPPASSTMTRRHLTPAPPLRSFQASGASSAVSTCSNA